MGINAYMIHWLHELSDAGHFRDLNSVLELGPQDFHFHDGVWALENLIDCNAGGPAERQAMLSRVFVTDDKAAMAQLARDQKCTEHAIMAFYGLLGLPEYVALDLGDPRAELKLDLNYPVDIGRQFDVITNFGTLEHIFNIGQAFQTIHDTLAVGGVALHILPTFGDYGHGFYNIHANLFRSMIYANAYGPLTLNVVHDLVSAGKAYENPGAANPSVSGAGNGDPENIDLLYNINSMVASRHNQRGPADFLQVAYKKLEDRPFAYPQQDVYQHWQ